MKRAEAAAILLEAQAALLALGCHSDAERVEDAEGILDADIPVLRAYADEIRQLTARYGHVLTQITVRSRLFVADVLDAVEE